MISVESQIQAILDGLGIHLDGESFTNLMRALRVDRLTWAQKFGLAVALGAIVGWIREKRKRQAAAAAAMAQPVVQG